jgi:PKD repeat protein
MKKPQFASITILLSIFSLTLSAQQARMANPTGSQKPTLITTSEPVISVPSITVQLANGTFRPAEDRKKEFNPKRWGSNNSVPGKGLPNGNDPLWEIQSKAPLKSGKAPILTFEAASASSTPTDPTGAVGPNHFVNSWNTAFRIWDKNGNPLTAAASLGTIFPGTLGDPIVVYDRYADRFMLTEFFSNGFDVAISQGPDPVNDGWYVYRFNTNTFPDYPKFSVWSDGYYITANKDQNTAGSSQVVFVLNRDQMITGSASVQMLGFPLTGIVTSGFYSPLGFNCNGPSLPPPGNAPIVYMQDDAWSGVSADHLKIWTINVNWSVPANSTISSPQIINTQPFDGLFDGGSFSNLPQPSGGDIDALQATIMYMAQYRRFPTYNSAVFNFVVDLNGADNYSGIRWYELRQSNDGAPWTIHQEGTYAQPGGHSAFCGNMCMDANGNIGLAYTIVSASQYPSLRFTGRYASDPPGQMTLAEEIIATGTQSNPSTRYGDYAQMTIDPTDDATFWSIGEYFNGGRKNHVGVFQIAPPALTADFSASPTTICNSASVTFTDQSLSSPTSWNWSFPGGIPSVFSGQTPPPVAYPASGDYDVSLTVSDGTNTSVETKTAYIHVRDLIPEFTANSTNLIVGNSVIFTDNSECNPTGWEWLFPGGNPSSWPGQVPPPVTYNSTGIYDITLTITKSGFTETITKAGYINVIPPVYFMTNGTITACGGDFYDSGGPSGNYQNNENLTLTFLPSTQGAMITVSFNSFNLESGYDYLKIYNGTSSSAALLGTFSGTSLPGAFTASNPDGALTFNFTSDNTVVRAGWTATIGCYNPTDPPVAEFSASATTTPVNTDITLNDLSENAPTSWLWTISPDTFTFINGTNADSQNPEVTFTSTGAYTVSLTASNAYGSDTEIKTNYINVVLYEYCIPSYTSGTSAGDYISLVQLGDINNATGASDSPYYTYFSNLTTDLNPGSDYTITLSPGTYGSGNNISVWIDYNQNGVFDTSEKLGNINIPPTPATGSVNFTVPENAIPGTTRMRVREVWNNSNFDPCLTYGYGETEDYNVFILSSDKILNFTVYLEGLYAGNGTMNQAFNAEGPRFSPGTADQVALELHNSADYNILEYEIQGINLGTNGSASVTFPAQYAGSYYLTIRHRNSLETTSAVPVSLSGPVTDYAFNQPSAIFGNNLKQMPDGQHAIFGGDVNQDGLINQLDIDDVNTNASMFISGYVVSDVNGDGLVDIQDFQIIDNNQFNFTGSALP